MIKRIERILEEAYYMKNQDTLELDITQDSYSNALAVEGLKQDVLLDGLEYMVDDIITIKQGFPDGKTTTVKATVDAVVMDGKDFRELQKLLNGLYEIWIQEKYPQKKEKADQGAS